MSNVFLYLLFLPLFTLAWVAYLIERFKFPAKILLYTLTGVLIYVLYLNNLVDTLSIVFSYSALYVSLFTSLYSVEYFEKKNYPKYASLLLDLFALSMIAAFSIPNILGLAVAWSFAELLGFTLISLGVKHSIEGLTKSPELFLLTSTSMSELSVFALVYIAVSTLAYTASYSVKGFDLAGLIKPFWILAGEGVKAPSYAIPLLLIGFLTKTALVPLHFWLPEAHTVAPTPASALLSGVMTSMGIYGLLRISLLTDLGEPAVVYAILSLSLISCVYGGLQAILQRDGKKLLAYSTIAGNGFAAALFTHYLYIRDELSLAIMLIAVLAHTSYKTTLFLDIGLVEQITGFRYIHRLRGLVNIAPISAAGSLLAFLSLTGLPPTIGFASKLFAVVEAVFRISDTPVTLVLTTILTYIALSIMIGLSYIKIYFGKPHFEEAGSVNSASSKQQYLILSNSLSSLLFTAALALYPGFRSYLLISALASPILLIFLITFTTVMRRG